MFLGAIGGIAHEALVIGYEQGGSPVAVAAGLTRGFMGAITKPLSATADFLALTGQGLLCQAGWDQHPLVFIVYFDTFMTFTCLFCMFVYIFSLENFH